MTVCPKCKQESHERLHLPHTTVWECQNPRCSLRFAAPQFGEAQLQAAYEKHYYPRSNNGAADIHVNTPTIVLRQVFDTVIRLLGGVAGRSLLDYGCGIGNLCRLARELGMEVVGIESDGPQPPVRHDLSLGLNRTFAKPLDRPCGSPRLPKTRWTDFNIYTQRRISAGASSWRSVGELRQPDALLLLHADVITG
jgi:hypothetical protein